MTYTYQQARHNQERKVTVAAVSVSNTVNVVAELFSTCLAIAAAPSDPLGAHTKAFPPIFERTSLLNIPFTTFPTPWIEFPILGAAGPTLVEDNTVSTPCSSGPGIALRVVTAASGGGRRMIEPFTAVTLTQRSRSGRPSGAQVVAVIFVWDGGAGLKRLLGRGKVVEGLG